MEKEVVPWFQMLSRTHPFQSWVGFTRALELEFGPSPFECPRSTLFKLQQTASVNEYYTTFTALANRVQGLSQDAILDCFLSGLKPDIRRDVLAQSPFSISKAVSLARLFEEKYTTKPKPYTPSHTHRPYQSYSTTRHPSLPPCYLPLHLHPPNNPPNNLPSNMFLPLRYNLGATRASVTPAMPNFPQATAAQIVSTSCL